MQLIGMIIDLFGLALDVECGKRYGFGFFAWKLAAFLCFLAAIVFVAVGLRILAVIGLIAGFVCGVFESRRFITDMRNKKQKDQDAEESKEP